MSEQPDGTIAIDKESIIEVDHGPIFKKLEDVGSQKFEEALLGEIMFKNDMVRITSKHIILLNRK